jgi:hypothetical protein
MIRNFCPFLSHHACWVCQPASPMQCLGSASVGNHAVSDMQPLVGKGELRSSFFRTRIDCTFSNWQFLTSVTSMAMGNSPYCSLTAYSLVDNSGRGRGHNGGLKVRLKMRRPRLLTHMSVLLRSATVLMIVRSTGSFCRGGDPFLL